MKRTLLTMALLALACEGSHTGSPTDSRLGDATGNSGDASLDATPLDQKHYYVAPNGDDSSNGSCPTTSTPGCTGGPWATISHADNALSLGPDGAVVHVAAGSYGGAVQTLQDGTATARIRFISDTPHAAKLTGGGTGVVWSIQGAYTDVVGFEIDAITHPQDANGIVAYSHNALIQSNKVHNIASGCNSSQTAVLESAGPHNPGEGNDFERNIVFHNNCGAGSWTMGTQPGSVNTGISLHSYDIARNNLIVDQDGWGMQVSHDSTNNIVTNNTIINCDRAGMVVGYTSPGTVDYTTISNNIVVNNGSLDGDGGIVVNSTGCGAHNLYANNLLYGNVGGQYVFSSCTNTSSAMQGGSDATTFVAASGTIAGDFHLRAGSSAIDHGTSVCALTGCAPAVDLDGVTRPKGAALDIGAYEYQ